MNKIKDKTRIKCMITMSIIISLFTFLSLCAINVYALGIAPSKKIINYDTEQHIITSNIINNEARDFTVRISASGQLSEYINITEPILNIRSDEPEKIFKYTIQLPSNLDPGPKTISISVSEINIEADENSIGGLTTLTQQLQINVPYTGLYAESYLSIYATTTDNPIRTMLKITNAGDQNIQSLSGTLSILDFDNNTVYITNVEEYKDIFPKESLNIDKSFFINNSGIYILKYNMSYDHTEYGNKNIIVTKEFNLGEYNISVLNASVQTFRLGTVAKLNIDISSGWNGPIDNVYGSITLKDKYGIIVKQANITKTTINPYADSLTAYLDTVNILSGEYKLGIKLYAGNKVITREYTSIISNNMIQIGNDTETIDKTTNSTLAIVLILTALSIIVLLISRQNKKLYK